MGVAGGSVSWGCFWGELVPVYDEPVKKGKTYAAPYDLYGEGRKTEKFERISQYKPEDRAEKHPNTNSYDIIQHAY